MPHVPDTVPGKRVTDAGARTEGRGQPSNIRGGSRMQESCPYGSVRGAPSNGCPYRNRKLGLRRGRRLALYLGSLTLRRRGPDWNATKRRQDSERRASTAAERGIEKTDELRRLKNARNRTFESISLQR